MKKPRKNTKTYKAFSSLIKNMVEQKRYYGKRGIDVPDVRDYFTRSDASAANLRGLRKFKKQIVDPFIRDIKSRVQSFRKDKGVSTSTAYKRLSGLLSGHISAADVTLETFRQQIDKFPSKAARDTINKFMDEFSAAVEDKDELARILTETAEKDAAFEALMYGSDTDEEFIVQNTSLLMTNMLSKLRETQPLTADILADKIESFMFS